MANELDEWLNAYPLDNDYIPVGVTNEASADRKTGPAEHPQVQGTHHRGGGESYDMAHLGLTKGTRLAVVTLTLCLPCS